MVNCLDDVDDYFQGQQVGYYQVWVYYGEIEVVDVQQFFFIGNVKFVVFGENYCYQGWQYQVEGQYNIVDFFLEVVVIVVVYL